MAMSDSGSKHLPSGVWKDWVEPWYVAYAFLGMVALGLSLILIPLVIDRTAGPEHVGVVMAAFFAGGLTAPIWGSLAERHLVHRGLLAAGMVIAGIGMVLFPLTNSMPLQLGLALLQSIGIACAGTIPFLLVVNAHPEAEWHRRLGWLQTFYGMGRVVGLLLAGALSLLHPGLGLQIGAGLIVLGAVVGWFTVSRPPEKRPAAETRPKHVLPFQGIAHDEFSTFFHHLEWRHLKQMASSLDTPFGLFMLLWVLAIAGPAAVIAQYPVLMKRLFQINSHTAALIFGLSLGAALLLSVPAGLWADRFGPARIMASAWVMRVVGMILMLAASFIGLAGGGIVALAGYAIITLAWPLVCVSGSALTAHLSPIGQGAGMGIYNAGRFLALVIGSAVGGVVAAHWGYQEVIAIGLGFLVLGLVLNLVLIAWLERTQS